MVENRKCNKCAQLVDDINPVTKKIYASCALCRKTAVIKRQKYRKENPELIASQRKTKRQELRQKVLDTYGRFCSHCGETNVKMLTIDHINGGGGEHRKKIGKQTEAMCKDVLKEYKPDIYQILCIACNWHKGMFNKLPELEFCYEDIREG